MTFEEWMQKIDEILVRESLLGYADLPDWHYTDAYEDDMSPEEAAKAVLANAMGE